MYQRIWTPHVGEKATTVREPGNEHDRFAVAVLKDETLCTVGHLPREISKECFIFKLCIMFLMLRHSLIMLSEFLFLHYIVQIIIFERHIIRAPTVVS